MGHALEIAPLTAAEVEALDTLYRTTTDRRVRLRAQIVLLAGEQGMTVSAIAKIVRETGSSATAPKALRGSKIVRCREGPPRSRRSTR
jgi:hypothetical protein